MKPLVYVAAPYTKPDPVVNTRAAVRYAESLVTDGIVTPVVPHLSMLWHTISEHPYEYWLAYDIELMLHCTAVIRLPGESTGADGETAKAAEVGIPVFASARELYEWLGS